MYVTVALKNYVSTKKVGRYLYFLNGEVVKGRYCSIFENKVKLMKNMLKKLIFIAQIHLLDPEPYIA